MGLIIVWQRTYVAASFSVTVTVQIATQMSKKIQGEQKIKGSENNTNNAGTWQCPTIQQSKQHLKFD